jgi:hypothetical protein
MRVTIIPASGLVSIDGENYSGLNLSFIAQSVHAVQWYDTYGEIEHKDERSRMIANESIDSIEQFQFALDLWLAAKQQAQEALQAQSLQEQGEN